MRITPPGAAEAGPRGVEEDSDVIVALIRTAFIIAFYAMRYFSRGYPVPMAMDVALWSAAIFNLLLLVLYLRQRRLYILRPEALLLDLLLVSAAVATFRQGGQDLSDLYYLVIIAAAVWYRLPGSVSIAILAVALAVVTPYVVLGHPLAVQSVLYSPDAILMVLIAIIAGYLMRARDAEHLAIVELRQEMRLARVLQSRMLPSQLPFPPGYDMGIIFSPARTVGGDFYDLRLLDPDHLLIVLADMSGKSVYGLVHLSLVHSHLQSAANEGLSPAAIAQAVNRGTYAALQPESYAAMFIGILRLSDGLLNFVNCGHLPPVRLRRAGKHEPDLLSTGGAVIGAVREIPYEERVVTLGKGDTLICYSDGIADARNAKREQFGEDKVVETAQQDLGEPAQEIAKRLAEAAMDFAARPGQDDITVLVITRQEH